MDDEIDMDNRGNQLKQQEWELKKRMDAVMFLRQSAAYNKQRMNQANDLLNGSAPADFYGIKNPESDDQEEKNADENNTFKRSLFLRVMISALLGFSFFAAVHSNKINMDQYKNILIKTISVDYSENLFDFMKKIPYTFEYEKINA